jgi:hypothetical protein
MFGRKKKPPASAPPPASLLRCSFCNKSQQDVKKLIAGPNVQICNECVDICLSIMTESKKDEQFEAKDGGVAPVGRGWSPPGALLRCALCRIATPPETSLLIVDRGIICAGCAGAVEAALAERTEPS